MTSVSVISGGVGNFAANDPLGNGRGHADRRLLPMGEPGGLGRVNGLGGLAQGRHQRRDFLRQPFVGCAVSGGPRRRQTSLFSAPLDLGGFRLRCSHDVTCRGLGPLATVGAVATQVAKLERLAASGAGGG